VCSALQLEIVVTAVALVQALGQPAMKAKWVSKGFRGAGFFMGSARSQRSPAHHSPPANTPTPSNGCHAATLDRLAGIANLVADHDVLLSAGNDSLLVDSLNTAPAS